MKDRREHRAPGAAGALITRARRPASLSSAFALLLALVPAACGGEDGPSEPEANGTDGGDGWDGTQLPERTLVSQESMELGAWESLAAGNADLKQIVGQVGGTLRFAGAVEDDLGKTVSWGAYGNSTGEVVALLACDGGGACTASKGSVSGGTASFSGADGKPVDPPLTVAPPMVKDLAGTDFEGKTTLPAALTAEEVPAVDLKTRRFTLANAFGAVFGVTMPEVVALAKSSGAFSSVNEYQYVGRKVVEDAIGLGGPYDALVWVGASVRMEKGSAHRTIGMTVNRGIYGDETVTAGTLKSLLKVTPYGGPGLVVLVAGESEGDGSGQEVESQALFHELADPENQHRVLVGFRGQGRAEHLLDAATVFLTSFFGGATLEASVQASNEKLKAWGTPARLVSNRDASIAGQVTFMGRLDGFWGANPAPTGVRSNHFVLSNLICFPKQGDAYQEGDSHANFWVDLDFDGPFFQGSRQAEPGIDVTVEGVLGGKKPGAKVFLKISGDLKESVKGITVFGVGTILEKQDEQKPARIFYDGEAIATTYTNDKGDECELKSPALHGSTSQPSWMDLP